MKNKISLVGALCLMIFITGCGIRGMWMNGSPSVTPIKPYLQRWEKFDATSEVRREDAYECGGGRGIASPGSVCWETPTGCPDIGDDVPVFSQRKVKTSQHPGEKESETYNRLHRDWQRCMIGKGYHYTGECYDSAISRATPACGAP